MQWVFSVFVYMGTSDYCWIFKWCLLACSKATAVVGIKEGNWVKLNKAVATAMGGTGHTLTWSLRLLIHLLQNSPWVDPILTPQIESHGNRGQKQLDGIWAGSVNCPLFFITPDLMSDSNDITCAKLHFNKTYSHTHTHTQEKSFHMHYLPWLWERHWISFKCNLYFMVVYLFFYFLSLALKHM